MQSLLHTIKLPVMPQAAHALIRTLSNENASVASVREIIAKDPALTASLLRMANSALFGLPHSVNTLDHALNVVGMTQIRARALGICMTQTFQLPASIDRQEFWRYSMVCAGYAKFLAARVGIDEQQAWLSGLMLRLGELVLALAKPELIGPIEQQPRAVGERWQRERAVIGYDEGQIIAEVARRWNFPAEVVHVLGHCTDPLAAVHASPQCAVVHLAACWADNASSLDSARAAVLQSSPQVLEYLRLDAQILHELLPDPELFCTFSELTS